MSIYDKLFGERSEERDFLIERGFSLSRLGDLKKAEEAFRKAIKIDPKSVDAHIGLGLLLEKSGKYKDAEKEYRAALRIDPNKVEMHNQIGTLFLKSNRYDEAEKELKSAIKINPNIGLPHRNLGVLFFKTHRIEKAIEEFEIAARLHREEGDHEMAKKLEYMIKRLKKTKRFGIDESTRPRTDTMKLDKTEGLSKENPIVVETITEEYRFTRKYKCPRCKNIGFHMVKHGTEHYFGKVISVHFAECNSCSFERVFYFDASNADYIKGPTMSDDERWKRANQLLHELFELYINQDIQQQTKQKLLTDIVEKNRYTIYMDSKFLELLDSEIKKTKKHGPPFMALVYLELRWAITGEKKHLKELEKYSRKARKMSLEQLTDISL